jgi:hypothetical protein
MVCRPAAWLVLLFLPAFAVAADPLPESVTFAEHIAPIVFAQCSDCHRAGQVAPFPLLSYADTKKHAKTALRVIKDREMPPWQPAAGHGEFQGERRLTDTQIALFEKWVKTGLAEGDASKCPPAPTFADGWQLGKPDLIVKMDRTFDVPADGPDLYQNFVLPLNLTEDKWVTAVEFQATAPTVVHHVLYFLDADGRGRAAEAKAAKGKKDAPPGFPGMGFRPTGALGGWAVGAKPVKLPGGLAMPLPKGSDLVLQTHFHPSGKAEKETLTVGIYFADKAPTRTLHRLSLPPAFGLFSQVDIPSDKADFKVSDEFVLPCDVDMVGAGAHAHYLGKTLAMTGTGPDAKGYKLFRIDDWNFNWQGQYLYKEFLRLPKGTVLKGEVTWDNSKGNVRNPNNPPVRVKWGEGSGDEMGSVGLMLVAADEKDSDTLGRAIKAHTLETILRSKRRGDEIDWERLGLPVPPLWKSTPPRKDKE